MKTVDITPSLPGLLTWLQVVLQTQPDLARLMLAESLPDVPHKMREDLLLGNFSDLPLSVQSQLKGQR
jgi:hypothetical protein